ncbi:unnamed protein product [Scytosiphon promiscuus]
MQSAWETYTKCDPRPDATSEKALNTFLSQGADEEVSELEQAMEICVYGESIAAHLLNGTGEALENGDISRMSRNERFLQLLRDLSFDKIDFATAHLLSHWDSLSAGDEDFDRMCTTAGGIRFGVWVNVSLKGFRMKTVDFAAAGMSTDVPRPLSGASVAVRNIFVPYHFVRNSNKSSGGSNCLRVGGDTIAGPDWQGNASDAAGTAVLACVGAVQKDAKIVLGGTFFLEILALPPGVKKIKGWIFRAETELSRTVLRQTYPLDGGNAALAPALRVQFEIPGGVIIPNTPEVRCWDPQASAWTSEGIDEAEWQPAKRVVRVHTTRVGAIAIVQDRARDLSYLSWRLTPIYDPDPLSEGVQGIDDDVEPRETVPEAELQLETPRFVVRLRIRGTQCRLLGPDLPELRSLLHAPGMGAGCLIMELERAGNYQSHSELGWARGIRGDGLWNNVPGGGRCSGNECGGKGQVASKTRGIVTRERAAISGMLRTLESTLCREVASVAAAFEIKSSRWNSSVGEGRAVFEVRETGAFTGGEGDTAIDFKTALMELDQVSDSAHNAPDVGHAPCAVKCALVNGDGDGDDAAESSINRPGCSVNNVGEIDTTRLPGEETHAYLVKCLSRSSCEEATDRAQQSCCRFQKAVEQASVFSVAQAVRPPDIRPSQPLVVLRSRCPSNSRSSIYVQRSSD